MKIKVHFSHAHTHQNVQDALGLQCLVQAGGHKLLAIRAKRLAIELQRNLVLRRGDSHKEHNGKEWSHDKRDEGEGNV